MNRPAIPVLTTLVIILGVALVFSRLTQSSLQEENQSLRKQLEALTASKVEESGETAEVAANKTAAPDEELVRLRGEVTTLRTEKKELEKLRTENQALQTRIQQAQSGAERRTGLGEGKNPRDFPRESWTNAGHGDPESAFQSILWAGASGNANALIASITPDQWARMQAEENKSEAEIADGISKSIAKINSFHILKSQPLTENEVVLTLFLDGLEGSEQTQRLKMQRVGNEWRLAGPHRPEESAQKP